MGFCGLLWARVAQPNRRQHTWAVTEEPSLKEGSTSMQCRCRRMQFRRVTDSKFLDPRLHHQERLSRKPRGWKPPHTEQMEDWDWAQGFKQLEEMWMNNGVQILSNTKRALNIFYLDWIVRSLGKKFATAKGCCKIAKGCWCKLQK